MKKIIFFVVIMMMFVGVVNASSINGDYNGYPILKVTSSEQEIEPGPVPALMYGDSILIPASILRTIGVGVKLSENASSVDLSVPKESKGISINTLMKTFGPNGKNHLLSHLEYSINGEDYTQLNLYPTFILWDSNRSEDFHKLLLLAGAVDVQKIRIEDAGNTITFINPADIVSFYRGELNSDDFATRIEFVEKKTVVPIATTPVPVNTSSAIESTIDGEFNGWTGETIFKLSNGQIWQQESYDYTYTYDFMPKVLIYKSGSRYKMKVDGVKETIDVKQIK
jgi:hypothetical protein